MWEDCNDRPLPNSFFVPFIFHVLFIKVNGLADDSQTNEMSLRNPPNHQAPTILMSQAGDVTYEFET